MEYAIEINNVTKKFGDVTAVDNLSVKLPKGTICGFVGPNGAGKTTTIKMLMGLIKPTSGELFVNGVKVKSGLERKLHVGYLPDVPGFYDWMTAEQYLHFCGKLLQMDKEDIRKRTAELLERFGLSGVKTKIKGYSRGMKQRLGIAQALIGDPSVVLLDEPASALDPIGRKAIFDLILSLKGKVTVLFSTHIIADVERVCDTVLIMDKGVLKVNTEINELTAKQAEHIINMSVKGEDESINTLVSTLENKEYIKSVGRNQNGIIQIVALVDMLAGREIPALINEHSLALMNYNVQTRRLESIFLEVVSHE
jgi:ABC-2 type transport system ATP-binding protein